MPIDQQRIFAFARDLLPAVTFSDLLDVVAKEVETAIGYRHVWLMVAETEGAEELRLVEFSGPARRIVWERTPVLKVKGDPFLEELIRSTEPIVIEDARVDERTNKQIVEQLQNRTLINIPLRLLDRPLGVFGTGTFGDEGCRSPTPDEIEYLRGVSTHVAVAAGRLRFMEERARIDREKLVLERRLMQAQKLESLGLLAGGIAHDFNNLLTVILSSASLAEPVTTDPFAREDIRAIIEASVRGRDLTRKLLAMSQQQGLELKPVDLNARLGDLSAMLRRVLPESIEIDLIRGARLPLIQVDPTHIDQVFMNLCIHAREAMPDGGGLTLETEQVLVNGKYAETHPWAKPGRYVLTTVTDTGSGMSHEEVERVFDPVFSVKDPELPGTRLGLAVAYGIVRQHGGMLHCYSEVGVGTSFKVYLPSLEQMAADVGTRLVGAVPRGTGDERILVAEDDPSVRAIATRILRRAGYRVDAVESGDAACEAASKAEYDLVILDVVMPGIPCRQSVERLRVILPGATILLSSGYTAGAMVTDLMRDTGLELVNKPYDPDQLLFSVRRVLQGAARPLA